MSDDDADRSGSTTGPTVRSSLQDRAASTSAEQSISAEHLEHSRLRSTEVAADDLVGRDEWPAVIATGRPFVVYKYAASLDGRIAAADTTSQWISSAVSRAEVQRLRAACHATMIGSGTMLIDDPQLAVRADVLQLVARPDEARLALRVDDARAQTSADPAQPPSRATGGRHARHPRTGIQPYRVVVDTDARMPSDARILDDAAPTVVAVADDADAEYLHGRADVVRVARGDRGVDLTALLAALFDRGVRGVLLEGGPTLAGSMVAAGLVDRVIGYVAPVLLGAGAASLGAAGIATLADAVRLDIVRADRCGADVRIVARPRPAGASY